MSVPEWTQTIYNVFAIIAIGASAGWFFTRRLRWPRAKFEHRIEHYPLSDNKILLRVVVIVTNLGEVLLPFAFGVVKVYRIKPWPDVLLNPVSKGDDPVSKNQTIVNWPLVAKRNLEGTRNVLEVEPGESDEFPCDFVIDANLEVIEVYSYVENPKKTKMIGSWQRVKEGMGWSKTTTYHLI